jgi:hypothetical protein
VDTGLDSSRANGDITAVITNYNYGRYLTEAVDSVLRQGARAVVVDDGSTEPVPDLPEDVELIRQANQGVATARNTGLARVQSSYVIVLDADDRLAPGALDALRRPLDADPQLGFAYGRMRFFGDWAGELRFPPYDPYGLLYRHTIGLTALVRREVFAASRGLEALPRPARVQTGVSPAPGQAFRAVREPSARPPERYRPPLAPSLLGPPAGAGPPRRRSAPPFLAKSLLSKPF